MIEFQRIGLTFDDKQVFRDFSLQVATGEKVLIAGKSGVGKTTLLRLILGWVRPDSGKIFVDGDPINAENIWNIRRRTAYIAQGLEIGRGPVQQLIDRIFSFHANHHLDRDPERTHEILHSLELQSTILTEPYERLSGGEKQRIAILISLLLSRTCFLLDEATAALDGELKEKVVELFMSRPDTTVLAVSHDPAWTDHPAVRTVTLAGK